MTINRFFKAFLSLIAVVLLQFPLERVEAQTLDADVTDPFAEPMSVSVAVSTTVGVSIRATRNAAEPNQNGQFTVSLSEAVSGTATLNYSVNGSATAGSDYQSLSGSVSIPAGSTSATLHVIVIDDDAIEGDETVSVTLTGGAYTPSGDSSGPVTISIGSPSSATVTLADDDFLINPPTCTITSPASGTVQIAQGGHVDFSGSVTSSAGLSTTLNWRFPGGEPASSTSPSVEVTYNETGTFTATLSGTDAEGHACTPVTRRVEVAGVAPIANIINPEGNQTINVGDPVSFAGEGRSGNPNADLSYEWNFGDGRTSDVQSPGEITFSSPDTYTVTFTVTDQNNGLSDSDQLIITVEQLPLNADFTVTSAGEGAISVEAQTKDGNLEYSWNFGENADPPLVSGPGQFGPITVRYVSGGKKTITLEISDPSGTRTLDARTLNVEIENASPEAVDELLQDFADPNDPGQQSATSALANACTTGGLGGTGTLCDVLINDAEAAKDDLDSSEGRLIQEALRQLTNQDGAKAAGEAGIRGINMQMGIVGSRIAALRQSTVSGFDIGGLSVQDGNTLISGRQIQSLGEALMQGGAAGDGETGFSQLGVFISGRISRGDRDATTNTDAYEYQIHGLTLGADYRVRDDLIVGAALGYSDTSTEFPGNNDDKLDSDGLSATFYGTWYRDESFFVDGSITYGRGDYDQNRNLDFTLPSLTTPTNQTFNANFDGNHLGIALNTGYEIRLAQQPEFALTPSLRLQYVKADIDGYRESASNPDDPTATLGMEIDSQEFTSFTSSLGVQASYTLGQSWGVAIPFVGIEWVHEFERSNDDVTGQFIGDATGTTFNLPIDDNDSNYFNLDIGVSAQFTNGTSGFVNYQRVLGYDDLDHYTINAGVRFEF